MNTFKRILFAIFLWFPICWIISTAIIAFIIYGLIYPDETINATGLLRQQFIALLFAIPFTIKIYRSGYTPF